MIPQNVVHSNEVIKILDIFEDAYLVYIVMEYMGGGDLNTRLNSQMYFSGWFDFRWLRVETQAARIIRSIGKGLLDLHEQNIYHLDVKPENIIYESNDKASAMKITDFGCSLLVEHFNRDTKYPWIDWIDSSEIVGTAGFMAPEVISVVIALDSWCIALPVFRKGRCVFVRGDFVYSVNGIPTHSWPYHRGTLV